MKQVMLFVVRSQRPPSSRLLTGVIHGERAFALVGVLALLVILAVAASIAVQSLEPALDEGKRVETEAEMERIAHAVAGQYALSGSLSGPEFGYVGDIGALPASLTDLTTNPGGYTTWIGPYIRDNFEEASGEFQNDAWGTAYVYTGGVTVQSTGSGSTLSHKIAATSADLLNCSFSGTILGADRSTPGICSVNVVAVVTYPDGIGGTTRDTSAVGGDGNFTFTGIPVGIRTVIAIDTIALDSVESFISILPRSTAANTSTGVLRLPSSNICP